MVQQDAAKRKKGPPKFQHLPKARAKQLKSAWVQTRKIKSKWNAEKRREGIQTESPSAVPVLQTPTFSVSGVQAGQTLDHRPQLTDVNTRSDAPPPISESEDPVEAPNSRTIRVPIHTSKAGPSEGSSQQKDRRSGRHDRQRHPTGYRGKKPTMGNRMNALLEKIRKDID